MQHTTVATEMQRRIRQRELAMLEQQEAEEREEARKNKGFTQVYSKGWKRVRELATGNAGAAGLYALFAEHIDPTCGAVICDQQFLADHMQVSTRTIRRWLDFLEAEKALVRIPIAGRVCAYALDPREVWKGYDNAKEYAAFVTKTLVNKDGDVRRRIMSMFSPEDRPADDRDPNTPDMFERVQ
ncbi:helix-turn-helix domain-containing protein [Salmonella enterica]|nr:helix-turn-helix domain-containing protein [Salmonella enterica]EBH9194343.1 helix-turn-helix domain-containing protein [Salmonella enterica subsp. enterica serovar 4,[5],12:i:-]EBH9245670.1 helix-turn-helix domain-containing protein [Salmonella enterica subsp. enterica serovar 4,[5],12:i:-]